MSLRIDAFGTVRHHHPYAHARTGQGRGRIAAARASTPRHSEYRWVVTETSAPIASATPTAAGGVRRATGEAIVSTGPPTTLLANVVELALVT